MIRITEDTPTDVLNSINEGNFVTDGFSKTGIVATINVTDDGLYKIYEFVLTTDRIITIKR